TLLGLVQADVRADRRPPGPRSPGSADDNRPLLGEDDDSLRVHACPGRSRQVEVVRDAVLHLFRADPTLEPRDVIVMCPDIESFAPLVQAAFGTGGPAQGERVDPDDGVPRLRVRLADRSLRQTNPLLAVAAHLLELAGDRLTASQVLDLASREPVSRRFGFDEEALSRLERWVADAGIRWGLDAAHRSPWGLQDLGANTWEAGLDRLALGVAMGDASLFAGTVPAAPVAGEDVDLAGRLIELVERLRQAVVALAGPQPIARWAAALAEATERLARAGQAEAWQHDQLHRVLDDAVAESGDQADDAATCLDLAEVRSLLGDRLQGRPTRANFRTGDLTICTMVPMRSVPHRVVCLLGLDDGTFPRQSDQDGDDLLVAEPLVGDRDPRSEDRQLLLDALLAATEHLVVTYGSSDLRTNRRRPPSVPVAELLDVVDRTVRLATPGRRARDAILVQHPLQSFDPRNFSPGGLGTDGPFSFDRVNLAGAGLGQVPAPATGFLGSLLPAAPGPALQLGSLVRFVEHPVRAFLRDRLGLYDTDGPDRTQDHLPVELDPLERWAVGDRLLGLRLEGASPERALAVERGRGLLPPGPLADAPLAGVGPTVEALVAVVEGLACAGSTPGSVEVNLALPDGRVLLGTVPGVRDATIVACVYATLGPRHRLGAWVRFLALSAARPDLRVAAVTVGRSQRRRHNRPRVEVATLPPLADDPAARAARALDALEVLVDLHDRGMREPLPLYCATSGAWAEARRAGADPVQAARDRWESRPAAPPGEDRDPDHVLVLGPGARLPDLLRTPPAADEAGDTWAGDEGSRLGRLARRAWDGLLDHEHREVR
ncbi:MAG TPA: exodeoxyribonuclease V subunit gamma, partial [Acidimicrobiales bacterium]|nr:exodeoxyribonuclease V subunit gamma [Acidimicrobiales bacterium]